MNEEIKRFNELSLQFQNTNFPNIEKWEKGEYLIETINEFFCNLEQESIKKNDNAVIKYKFLIKTLINALEIFLCQEKIY